MIAIRPLAATGHDQLFAAWQEAFHGYARTWTQEELVSDLTRRGYAPEYSYAAFDGDRLVCFVLNGIGMYNGVYSAYDTGTGTIPEYRGMGLPSKLFDKCFPELRQAGVRQYVLEVLQDNDTAVQLYRKRGFTISRELNYFVQETKEAGGKAGGLTVSIERITPDRKDEMSRFWDFHPSWQNSFEAIERTPEHCISLAAFARDSFAGYGVIDPETGSLLQLAVDPVFRRKGVGSRLLKELVTCSRAQQLRVINTDTTCASMTAFLEQCNIPLRGKQYEMFKIL